MTLDWAIGLYEGEGTAYVSFRGRNTLGSLQVAIVSTDLDVLKRFKRLVKLGHINGPYKHGGNVKPYWRWSVHTWSEGLTILRSFYPQLCSRRKAQARVVFAAWKERKNHASGFRP